MTTFNCAAITWTINNFRYCWQKNNEAIASPVFCVKMPEDTKWKILLYPRGVDSQDTCISLFLYRELDCSGYDEIELEYTLDIVESDVTSVVDLPDVVKFRKGMRNGYPRYIHRIIVTTTKSFKYLPHDSLTIRCKIFRCNGEELEKQQIFARTIIGFEKRFFRWKVDEFGSLLSGQPNIFVIKYEPEDSKFEFNLSVTDVNNETILFGVHVLDPSVKFSTVKTFVMNTKNQEFDSGEYEYWFEAGAFRMFPLTHKKSRLMRNKSLYLPNNVLTLSFEVTFSRGFAFEGLEKPAVEFRPISSEVIENYQKCISHKEITNCPCALITDLDVLSKDQSTCDMKLQTKTDIFQVHTLILSARSPVFKAMFSYEMKEKINGCVDVSDFHDDTVRRFLLYLYSDQLEDMKWDDAAQLYEAADRFSVNSLRVKCCMYLKNNVNLGNACKALVFSDLHQERELKDFVQAFMLNHAKVIFKSEEWRKLMEANAKLALETTLRYWF